jgi:hypothetical protein
VKSYKIGDTGPAGGIVFYDKGNYSEGWRYLEVAPRNLPIELPWGPDDKSVPGTKTEIGTGKENTRKIVAFLKNAEETINAAQAADAYKYGAYDDWFLPSKDELNLLYANLKQKGLVNFKGIIFWPAYWSSSEYTSNIAGYQYFGDGRQSGYLKSVKCSVRAVRAF